MSKKLIGLISTDGKTSEQICKEAWQAFINFRAAKLGLKRCEKCSEYRGTAIDDGEEIGVKCICDGITCTKCSITKIRHPISNYFNETDGEIWHTPHFLHTCAKCNRRS